LKPVQDTPNYYFKILFTNTVPSTANSSTWFPFLHISSLRLCMRFSLVRVTRPAHLILLDMITLITFDEVHNSWRFSLRIFPFSLP
jgi:hypothetical protein